MARVIILGATGALGRHVLRQAVAAGHEVTVFVRTPSKLPPEVRERVSVHNGDLSSPVPHDLIRGQERADQLCRPRRRRRSVRWPGRPTGHRRGLASPDGAAGLLVSGGCGAPRSRFVRPPRRRPAQGEVHLLAPPGQLRAAEPLAPGLATALSRADGRRGRDRTGPAAHLGRHHAGSRSGIRPRSAGPAVPAGLRVPDSADDRALRRCGGRSCSPTSIAVTPCPVAASGWRFPWACEGGNRNGRPAPIRQPGNAIDGVPA